jgi:hypothetical protein
MSASAGLPVVAMPGSLAKGSDKAGILGGAHAVMRRLIVPGIGGRC